MVRSKTDVEAVLDMACIYEGKAVIAVKGSAANEFIDCSEGNCVFGKDIGCARKNAKGMHIKECRRIDDNTPIYFKYLKDYDKK